MTREIWDDRLRQVFGLAMLDHPARLQDGIRAACKELALVSEAELLSALERGEPAAKAALARALTVGETYFFREPLHLDYFRDTLLPAAIARGKFPVVVVSAACSSGEEAYTLAIVARQVLGVEAADKVRILGFDLNPQSITSARRGVYRPWSLRGMTQAVKDRWFDVAADGLSVKPEVRALVRFEPRNMVDPKDALEPGTVDVVFCRNVLIYFDDASVKIALPQLARALRPQGTLIVGTAESAFLEIAGLGAHAVNTLWVHTRDELPHTHPTPFTPLTPMPRRLPPPRRIRSKPTSERKPKPAPAPPPASVGSSNEVDVVLARGWKSLAGDPALAADEARRAILLDRNLAAGHILAASAALALRDLPGAQRSLRHARHALADAPAEMVLRGADGATASEMAAYCTRLEKALKSP